MAHHLALKSKKVFSSSKDGLRSRASEDIFHETKSNSLCGLADVFKGLLK